MFIVQLLCSLMLGFNVSLVLLMFFEGEFWRDYLMLTFTFIVWFEWGDDLLLLLKSFGYRYCNWRFDEGFVLQKPWKQTGSSIITHSQADNAMPSEPMKVAIVVAIVIGAAGSYTRPRLSAIQEESIGSYGLGGFVGGIFKDRLFRIEMEWLICVTIMV